MRPEKEQVSNVSIVAVLWQGRQSNSVLLVGFYRLIF